MSSLDPIFDAALRTPGPSAPWNTPARPNEFLRPPPCDVYGAHRLSDCRQIMRRLRGMLPPPVRAWLWERKVALGNRRIRDLGRHIFMRPLRFVSFAKTVPCCASHSLLPAGGFAWRDKP